MRLFLIVFLLTATFVSPTKAQAEPQTNVPSLANIIERYIAYEINGDPARAADEDDRAPDRWRDVSPETLATRAEEAKSLREALDRVPEGNAIDQAILAALLDFDIVSAKHDLARIPFTGDYGFHAEPVFAALQTRVQSIEDAEAWISRLNDVPRYFDEHITNMRRGIETGFTAHSDPLSVTIDQIKEQAGATADDSNLYVPLASLPDNIAGADASRLQSEGLLATKAAIAAYRDLLNFLESEYAPAARAAPGLASLEGGRLVYADLVAHHTAGAGLTPEEIHVVGLEEVARIRAEMDAIILEIEFEGHFSEFLAFLRNDARFYADTAEDLLEKSAEISKRLDAILPLYFSQLPRLPYGVSPVPASVAPGFTTGRYVPGNAEEGRPGTYLVNTYRLDQRPLYELPALSAHEAVPGHHLQIALSQELDAVPDFRRRYYATAFGEGWGLYAERLAGEAGIYRTPYERFGALSYEMWRACRLVADTGLHWYGWSRAEAETCFKENSALSPLNIETEVTRYIGWPGQATAYKIGEIRILGLRETAREVLGDAFDIRAFHDHLLGAGSMPLYSLDRRMEDWVQNQRSSPETTEETADTAS
ncbi:MAG: DUF885 domain-containing protein [Pseudomonadota bacterium]